MSAAAAHATDSMRLALVESVLSALTMQMHKGHAAQFCVRDVCALVREDDDESHWWVETGEQPPHVHAEAHVSSNCRACYAAAQALVEHLFPSSESSSSRLEEAASLHQSGAIWVLSMDVEGKFTSDFRAGPFSSVAAAKTATRSTPPPSNRSLSIVVGSLQDILCAIARRHAARPMPETHPSARRA